jgi:hypothetical protein
MQPNLIPALDPNPLPAPYWVFKLLLLLTFWLHLLAMNCLLGGGVLALLAKARLAPGQFRDRVFLDLVKKLPSLMAATISLGVAPLLFVQVLYGPFFYTSSILMAWPWMLVLLLLMVAYYGIYWASSRRANPGRGARVLLVSIVLIAAVGFLYGNNLTLSQTPAAWRSRYLAHPAGWNLNLSEPTLVPRFLHFFVAAIAIGGLFIALMAMAKWKSDPEYAHALLRFGGRSFMYATMAQFVIGFWFLGSLPHDQMRLFLGGSPLAMGLLFLALVTAAAAILVVAGALRRDHARRAVYLVSGLAAGTVALMVVVRDLLRNAYLKPYFHPQQFVIGTQWSVFVLFLVIFVLGLGLWFWMLARYGLFTAAKGAPPFTNF